MIYVLIVLPMIIFPALLLLLRKSEEKEAGGFYVLLTIGGAFAYLIAALLESIFKITEVNPTYTFSYFIFIFIVVSCIEEISKFAVFQFFTKHHREYKTIYQGILYASFASFGLAIFENIMYVILSNSIEVGLLRIIISVPIHLLLAFFMGYFYSRYRFEKRKIYYFYSLFIPILIHTIFNWFALNNNIIMSIVVWLLTLIICIYLFFTLRKSKS